MTVLLQTNFLKEWYMGDAYRVWCIWECLFYCHHMWVTIWMGKNVLDLYPYPSIVDTVPLSTSKVAEEKHEMNLFFFFRRLNFFFCFSEWFLDKLNIWKIEFVVVNLCFSFFLSFIFSFFFWQVDLPGSFGNANLYYFSFQESFLSFLFWICFFLVD